MKALFSFILLTALIASCKSSAQHTSKEAKEVKEGGYHEDLSLVSPRYELIEDTVTESESTDTSSAMSFEVTMQIDSVIRLVSNYNKDHEPDIKGYRVQIYNGGSQSKANKSLQKARKLLGNDIYGESKWTSPVFRTRVGCFVDRLNAYKVLLILQKDFPNALVVPDHGLSADCIH